MTVRRRVHTEYDLQDAADSLGVDLADAARDLALLSVMASLTETFGQRLVFKGGSALRFVHGAIRTSRDADATVTLPDKSPINASDVLHAIGAARLGQVLTFEVPATPRTNNKYSLDIDKIGFTCTGVNGTLDVELSYREALVLESLPSSVGDPYFEPFRIYVMQPVEMAAEKLRALAQRQRGTDLSDCVLLEQLSQHQQQHLLQVRKKKFELVRPGFSLDELLTRIDHLETIYASEVEALDPTAPPYEEARDAATRLARAAW